MNQSPIHYLNQQTFIQDNEYNAYERDIAVVNIFFGKTSVLGLPVSLTSSKKLVDELPSFLAEFERSPKMTWFDFISSFGGFCGLCLGISFVSVVEIIYWFSIRLCRNLGVFHD